MRTWEALARFWAEQKEIGERLTLLERPWEERDLHWTWEGGELVLHGEPVPWTRRRMSTTRGGRCRRAAGVVPCPAAPTRPWPMSERRRSGV